jgi:hypothetical protein
MHAGQVANTVICSGLFLALSLTLNFRQNYQLNCGKWAAQEEKEETNGKRGEAEIDKGGKWQ